MSTNKRSNKNLIFNSDDTINERSGLWDKYSKERNNPEIIDKLWKNIIIHLTRKNTHFNELLIDEDITQQIKSELVLQLFNKFCSSPQYTDQSNISINFKKEKIVNNVIQSAQRFLEETTFNMPTNKNNTLVYSDAMSFQRVLDNLHLQKKSQPISAYTLNNTLEYHPNSFIIMNNELVIENTPLSNYVNTHFCISSEKHFSDIEPKEQVKKSAENLSVFHSLNKPPKYKYHFINNGRYFLSVLLRAINSGTVPYSTDSQDGISLNSLNTFFKKLHQAYNSNELKANPMERYLFLCNTESIFQISFLYKIYESYAKHFIPAFYSLNIHEYQRSLKLISALEFCPLNTVKIATWNSSIESIFSISKASKEYSSVFLSKIHDYMAKIKNHSLEIKKTIQKYAIRNNTFQNLCKFSDMTTVYKRNLLHHLKEIQISKNDIINFPLSSYADIQNKNHLIEETKVYKNLLGSILSEIITSESDFKDGMTSKCLVHISKLFQETETFEKYIYSSLTVAYTYNNRIDNILINAERYCEFSLKLSNMMADSILYIFKSDKTSGNNTNNSSSKSKEKVESFESQKKNLCPELLLYDYLKENASTFSWSYLSKNYKELKTVFDEYLDFYTTCTLYPPIGSSKGSFSRTDPYLAFLINTKKSK